MASAPSLDVGALYAGVYEIGERLGGGGTGTVYGARHVVLEQERALKVLHRQAQDGAEVMARLRLEASVFGRLKAEPALVMPFDLGFDAATRTHFIAMELLEGSDLASWVRERGPLDVTTTLGLMRQVARGLDAAHRYISPEGKRTPIVHRDLTPSNIFLIRPEAASPTVKLLDFGLAAVLNEATQQHDRRSGTPLYRACEQAWGLDAVPQTDVWALGLVVHFALTGVAYWSSRSAAELHEEITMLPLERPSQRLRRRFAQADLPESFDDWFLRCLHRVPGRRFATAGEAVDELQLCFGGAARAPGHRVLPHGSIPARQEAPPDAPAMLRSRTVSRFADGPGRDAGSAGALVTDYVRDVHPAFKSLVRLADDLMTATGHYLAFVPESPAALLKQIAAVELAVGAYNAGSERLRGPLGRGAFERGIEVTPLNEAAPLLSLAIAKLLAFPERYTLPEPRELDGQDTILVYCTHSALWQTERVRLYSRLDVARRALSELERGIGEHFASGVAGSWSWAERAGARDAAEKLRRGFFEDLRCMVDAVARWSKFLASHPEPQPVSSSAAGEAWVREAWQLAEPIRRMNDSYVRLEERALELTLLLAEAGDAPASQLARDLTDLQAFQWHEVRPQLNSLLVHLIRLLTSEHPERMAQLVIADRAGWERLGQLLWRRCAELPGPPSPAE